MRNLTLPLILAALALSAPAAAQDGSEAVAARTPENARKFLSQLPARFSIDVTSSGSLNSAIGYRWSALQMIGACTVEIVGLPRWYVLRDSAENMFNNHLGGRTDPALFVAQQSLIRSRGIVQAPYLVEWGQMNSVEQAPLSGNTRLDGRTLQLSKKDWRVNLSFPSEELANRAMLAIETLRTACDRTADTGF